MWMHTGRSNGGRCGSCTHGSQKEALREMRGLRRWQRWERILGFCYTAHRGCRDNVSLTIQDTVNPVSHRGTWASRHICKQLQAGKRVWAEKMHTHTHTLRSEEDIHIYSNISHLQSNSNPNGTLSTGQITRWFQSIYSSPTWKRFHFSSNHSIRLLMHK